MSVKNYTDLDRGEGAVQVTVDNSWFLNPLPAGSPPTNLTIVAFYLPSTLSPYIEISSPISMLPRPFNFTVTRKFACFYTFYISSLIFLYRICASCFESKQYQLNNKPKFKR